MSSSDQINHYSSNKAIEPNELRAIGDFVSHCDNQKKVIFFPSYLWRLDHANLTSTFSELFGNIICSSRDCTALKPLDSPSHAQALASRHGSRDLSCLPEQRPGRHRARFAHRLRRCPWRRAERQGLPASVRPDWPTPLLPPRSLGVSSVAFPPLPLYGGGDAATGGRGGKRKEVQDAFAQCSPSGHLNLKQIPEGSLKRECNLSIHICSSPPMREDCSLPANTEGPLKDLCSEA